MLNFSLTAVSRGPVRLREQLPVDHPVWDGAGYTLKEPLQIDLEASEVGDGVLVRGRFEAIIAAECRRCLAEVTVELSDDVDLFFEPLPDSDDEDLAGEVYPLPPRGDLLDVSEALREQILIRIPEYVVCSEGCLGLCPQCGTDLNRSKCDCTPATEPSPWDALKRVRFN